MRKVYKCPVCGSVFSEVEETYLKLSSFELIIYKCPNCSFFTFFRSSWHEYRYEDPNEIQNWEFQCIGVPFEERPSRNRES